MSCQGSLTPPPEPSESSKKIEPTIIKEGNNAIQA